jgi:transposase
MSKFIERVVIITSMQRRRRYTANEKVWLVEQTMQPGMKVSAVAQLHVVAPRLLFQLRRRMTEDEQEVVRANQEAVPLSRVRELESRVRELERLLGRKTMEAEVLREALKAARPKTHLALTIAASRRFPVKAVANTLGVARLNLVTQLQQPNRPQRAPIGAPGMKLYWPRYAPLPTHAPFGPMRAPSSRLPQTSAGHPMTLRSQAGTMRLCASPSPSTPMTAKSSSGSPPKAEALQAR